MDNVILSISGPTSCLYLYENYLVIQPSGLFRGDPAKTIPIESIITVNITNPIMKTPYLQVVTPDLQVTKKDETKGAKANVVLLMPGSENMQKAQELQNYVAKYKSISRQQAVYVSPVQGYNLDDLEKLADLKEKGIITEAEFEEKKKQILGSGQNTNDVPSSPPSPASYQSTYVKKKKHTALKVSVVVFAFVIVGAAISAISTPSNNDEGDMVASTTPNSGVVEVSSDELLAFDDQTWPKFIELYNAHNTLVENIQAVADGNASVLDLYQWCEDAKNYFANMSLAFDYGTADYQKEYLSAFTSLALSDQLAVEALMDYLDSGNISDLSAASDHISSAVDTITVIATNRGTLLGMTDLTDDEIAQRIEESTSELQ